MPGQQVGDVGGGPSGVQGAADGLGREPVDGGAAGGLDVGGEREFAGEVGDERAGRDRGQVGLDEDLVDGRRKVLLQRGFGVVAGEQVAGERGQLAEPGEAERGGLAERPAEQPFAGGAAAAGPQPAEPGAQRVRVDGGAAPGAGEDLQDLPAGAGALERTIASLSALISRSRSSRSPASPAARSDFSQPRASSVQR